MHPEPVRAEVVALGELRFQPAVERDRAVRDRAPRGRQPLDDDAPAPEALAAAVHGEQLGVALAGGKRSRQRARRDDAVAEKRERAAALARALVEEHAHDAVAVEKGNRLRQPFFARKQTEAEAFPRRLHPTLDRGSVERPVEDAAVAPAHAFGEDGNHRQRLHQRKMRHAGDDRHVFGDDGFDEGRIHRKITPDARLRKMRRGEHEHAHLHHAARAFARDRAALRLRLFREAVMQVAQHQRAAGTHQQKDRAPERAGEKRRDAFRQSRREPAEQTDEDAHRETSVISRIFSSTRAVAP